MNWTPRVATEADAPALEELISRSARSLLAEYYHSASIEAAPGPVFGVDEQLIRDGTYFVVQDGGEIVGCGGWSRRLAVYGEDAARVSLSVRRGFPSRGVHGHR